MKLIATLGAVAVVLGIGITPAAAKLYKWVDEDGNVFYSDQIPPEQSSKRHQVLDGQGLVRESVRRAKTPEEIEQERRAKELQLARERAEREQAIKDQILLETFASERDLILARDDRLASVDSAINLASRTLTDLTRNYNKVDTQIKTMSETNQPIPGNLAIKHRQLTQQIQSHERALHARQDERDNIVAQFEADLIRYRELSALRQ